MDGVIVDSEAFYQEVLARFVREHGLDVSDDELRGLIGCAQQHFDKTLVAWYEALGAGTLSVAEAKRRYRLWRDRIPCDYRSLLFPGVREAVQGLADRGVRLALASSSPRSNIREVLGACCLSRAFEVVVSGAELVASKPDPRDLPARAAPAWPSCRGVLLHRGLGTGHHGGSSRRPDRGGAPRGALRFLARGGRYHRGPR